MKRTTIFVPEHLERDLQLYAQKHGKPTAAVVREALAAYISERPTDLPSFVGAFDSGRTDTAERHEELVFQALEPHGETPASRRKRPAARRRQR